MKKIITLFSLIILTSCANDTKTINSKKILGTYRLDNSYTLNQIKSNSKDESDRIANGFASILISSINVKVTFTSKKAIVTANLDKKEFSYLIKNDSIIYIKDESEDSYTKSGVIVNYNNDLGVLIIRNTVDKENLKYKFIKE